MPAGVLVIAQEESIASGALVIAVGPDGLLDTLRCASSGLYEATGVCFRV